MNKETKPKKKSVRVVVAPDTKKAIKHALSDLTLANVNRVREALDTELGLTVTRRRWDAVSKLLEELDGTMLVNLPETLRELLKTHE